MSIFDRPKVKIVSFPSLYPMGALTFAIACSHCKNVNSDKCLDCKKEIKSGFEFKEKDNDC